MPTRVALLIVLVIAIYAGCQQSDLGYPIKGKVKAAGSPILSGMILFEPDAKAGNTGPGAVAIIKDGEYSTNDQRGIFGGAYVVRIDATSGDPLAEDEAAGKRLFPPYEIREVLPAGATEKDFDVPASHIQGAR